MEPGLSRVCGLYGCEMIRENRDLGVVFGQKSDRKIATWGNCFINQMVKAVVAHK